MRQDKRRGVRVRHDVRGIRQAVLKDLLEHLVGDNAQRAEPCSMNRYATLNNVALTFQETHLSMYLCNTHQTFFDVHFNTLEGDTILGECALSRVVLGCVGWRHRVDHVGLKLERKMHVKLIGVGQCSCVRFRDVSNVSGKTKDTGKSS